MSEIRMVESGQMGRVACGRIAPDEDLAQGSRNAFVRGALGSLTDACLAKSDGTCLVIRGPAAEIVSLAGEVRSHPGGCLQAALTGVVVDTDGHVYGGPFVPGANPVCVALEVTLEQWLPEAAFRETSTPPRPS